MTSHPDLSPRIVTLTMNPALDITTATERVTHTSKLRCHTVRYDPGGGGVNVARVAAALGASVSAVFPVGGLSGTRVVELLAQEGVSHHAVKIGGITREDLTVDETSTGRQFRFVLPGPNLTPRDVAACLAGVWSHAAGAAYVVARGSLPPGVHPGFYQEVSDLCREVGAKFVLDTSGRGLQEVTAGVHLVKPSLRELREYTGRPLADDTEQLAAARELIDTGCADNVVVSRAGDDALLVTRTIATRVPPPVVQNGSGVGAGDALVAGIVVGLDRGWEITDALRLGMAAGAAMLLTPGTAVCRPEDVRELFERTRSTVDAPT